MIDRELPVPLSAEVLFVLVSILYKSVIAWWLVNLPALGYSVSFGAVTVIVGIEALLRTTTAAVFKAI